MMRALRINDYQAPLQVEELSPPTAGPGQIVVHNQATSLNPIDAGRASGMMRQVFPLTFPWIPGGDVSGTVASLGEGVTAFKVGDQVFGYSMTGGAYAEFVAIDASAVAIRPKALSILQGAAVGVVGQTALQAIELAKIGPGSTVLIQGGAGGVGSLAIQIAHKAGAYVITTAQTKQKDALLRLGADRVIDILQERFEDVVEPVDAVFDLVGRETLARSYALVRRGGILLTFNQPPDPQECKKHGVQGFFVQTKVTTEGLNQFAEEVSTGSIVPLIDHVETLWNPEGLWEKRVSGIAVGKVVFQIGSL